MAIGEMIVRIVGDNVEFDRAIDKSDDKLTAFGDKAIKVGKSLTLFVTTPLLGLAAAAVKSSATMESLEASFTTMLGSATKATKLMTDLKKMAAVTPFEATDLAAASKTLLQFGVANEKLLPTLKMLGDVSGGNNQRFNSMALVFGQIQSAGRLMGQDLLQLINAGFNPLQEISKKTGETMAELKARMEKGGVSAIEVSDAFKTATAAGGLFFKGMETASKTLDGLISTMKDDLATFGRSMVDQFMPMIKEAVKDVSALAQALTRMDEGTRSAVLVVAGLAAGLGPLIFGLGVATKAVATFKLGLELLGKNPQILVLVGLVTATLLVANAFKQAKIESDAYAASQKRRATLEEALLLMSKAQIRIDADDRILKKARIDSGNKLLTMEQALTDEGYKQHQQDLQTISSKQKIVNAYDNEKIAADDASEAAARAAQAEADNIKITVKSTEAHENLRGGIQGKVEWQEISTILMEGRQRRAEEASLFNVEETIVAVEALGEAYKEATPLGNGLFESLLPKIVENNDKWKQQRDNMFLFLDMLPKVTQIYNDFAKNQIDQITAVSDADLAANEKRFKDGLISQNEYEANKAAITKKAAQDAYAVNLATFQANQRLQAGQAIIDTASAIIGFLARPGGFAGVGLSVMAGILGAAQLGVIAGQQPPAPPAFADGGIVMPSTGGTLAQVAEAGQPEVIFPLDELNRFLGGGSGGGGGGDIHLQVNLDSRPFLDTIFPATRNRRVLISAGAVV
jgi:tape measure domain-containing protein